MQRYIQYCIRSGFITNNSYIQTVHLRSDLHFFVICFQRRKPNYFGGVYTILEATLNFFSPNDGNGLDRQAAQNAGKKN